VVGTHAFFVISERGYVSEQNKMLLKQELYFFKTCCLDRLRADRQINYIIYSVIYTGDTVNLNKTEYVTLNSVLDASMGHIAPS
jgi:hypothetical protein